jgi:hypothetical protein
MSVKGFPSGQFLIYGAAIGNALHHGTATLEELVALRDNTKAIIDSQGDLRSALQALDTEIGKRSAGTSPSPSERFVIQLDNILVDADGRKKMEHALNEALRTSIASLDSQGDLIATPLSELTTFGAGLGGATAGAWIRTRRNA